MAVIKENTIYIRLLQIDMLKETRSYKARYVKINGKWHDHQVLAILNPAD
ncbi:hypothetical protein J7I81_12490 [Bacillus sp. ISL-32]|nr:hypothetical protein [Bacillus sp. ISL-32]